MKNKKTLLTQSDNQSSAQAVKQSGFNLIQVDLLNENNIAIRTSYEVVDPNEDAIGRFGSLQEAHNFIDMLCLLNES